MLCRTISDSRCYRAAASAIGSLFGGRRVGAGDIAKIILFAAATFTIGLCTVASLAFLVAPGEFAPLAHIGPGVAAAIGGVALAVLLALLITAAINRRPVTLWRIRIPIPSVRMVLAQMAISGIDIAFAAAVLYTVLPPLPGMSASGDFSGYFPRCAAARRRQPRSGRSRRLRIGHAAGAVPRGAGWRDAGRHRRLSRDLFPAPPDPRRAYFSRANEFLWRKPARLAQLRVLGGAGIAAGAAFHGGPGLRRGRYPSDFRCCSRGRMAAGLARWYRAAQCAGSISYFGEPDRAPAAYPSPGFVPASRFGLVRLGRRFGGGGRGVAGQGAGL